MGEKKEYSELTLKIKSRTQRGQPGDFEILYDFKESHDFVEATSQPEFLFIRPWLQFPNKRYNESCVDVATELVHRFNTYPALESKIKMLENQLDKVQQNNQKLER